MIEPRPVPDYTATGHGAIAHPAPSSAPDMVRSETATVAQAGLAAVPRRRGPLFLLLTGLGFIVLGLLLLFVLAYLVVGLGATGVIVGGILALVPLAIVFAGIRLDRSLGARAARCASLRLPLGCGRQRRDRTRRRRRGAERARRSGRAWPRGCVLRRRHPGAHRGGGRQRPRSAAAVSGPCDGTSTAPLTASSTRPGSREASPLPRTSSTSGRRSWRARPRRLSRRSFVRGLLFALRPRHVLGLPRGRHRLRRATARSLPGCSGYFLVGLIPAILLHAFWNGALFLRR